LSKQLAAARRERIVSICRQRQLAAVLVYGNAWRCDYLRYVTDFAQFEGHGAALVEPGRVRLYLESRADAERASAQADGVEAVWLADFFGDLRRIVEAEAGAGPIGVAPASQLPFGLIDALARPSVDVTRDFDQALRLKLAGEVDAVRRAAQLADEGYEEFCRAARAGRMEYEVVADLERFFRSRGCPDNFMIMASGGVDIRAMHPPGAKQLAVGELVTTELTPCIEGYYAQICRTLVIGPPSKAQQAAFDVHLEALEVGLAAVRPGVTGGQLARLQNDVFRRHGLGEYTTSEYTRVRGHGLGLYVDSSPPILEEDETVLAPGMTLIVHPNGYHPDAGYLVLGDAVVVRDDGYELLTATPRKLFSVPA